MPAPYKILTLGDSVMWGQGLLQQHKFSQLAADFIRASGRDVTLAALPHPGAVVCDGPTLPGPHMPFLFGEMPRSFPSISSQLAVAAGQAGYAPFLRPETWDLSDWQAYKRFLQQQIAGYSAPGGSPPDLILLDGGINDLGALQLVVPWFLDMPDPCAAAPGAAPPTVAPGGTVQTVLDATAAAGGNLAAVDLSTIAWITDDQLRQLVDRFVYDRIRRLVGAVANAFGSSRVVVTGYFPIFTQGSAEQLALNPAAALLFTLSKGREHQLAALNLALHPHLDRPAFANQIVHQSALWYSYSTQRLREIVAEANNLFGRRFALASPAFGPQNGALAADSYLWSFVGLVDDIIQKILQLFGGGTAAPPPAGALSPAAAPSLLPSFGLDLGGLAPAVEFVTAMAAGAVIATDEVGLARVAAATAYVFSGAGRTDPGTTAVAGFTTGAASVGHPNPKGAQAYFEAIKAVI
ncbi:MAG TPA: hypothetical protein VHR45_20060 [Thermoanaerobaculia bacterium]|nr:hypothetical protein [Thermoanaerobaculia bacterium]